MDDRADRALNEGYEYVEQLEGSAEGSTLLDYLSNRYTHSSRQEWSDRIEGGRVLLDGQVVPEGTPIRPGQTLLWRRPPWEEPSVPGSFTILYEDEDLLAVDKPAGLPSLPAGGYLQNTLLTLVRRHDSRAVPVHRLGRWTSGIVLCALTPAARSSLAECWRTAAVTKRYRALASGRLSKRTTVIETPIGKVPHAILRGVYAASASGKTARSEVSVIEERPGAFLADVRITTGRPHQIRIHLAAIGHPLVGDPLYPVGGIPAPDCTVLPGAPGYQLHAAELCLLHPRTGKQLQLLSDPPQPLRSTRG